MRQKKTVFIIIIMVAIGLGVILYPWGALLLDMKKQWNPPEPEIAYGEFPIRITCEINGEVKIIEDVVVCEFDGFESLGEAGRYRKWKSYLKSGNERLTLLREETETLIFEIYDDYGLPPEYYMSDFMQPKEFYEEAINEDKYLGYIQWENGVQSGTSILKEEVWEKYKLKIVDVQYSKPIQNSFN